MAPTKRPAAAMKRPAGVMKRPAAHSDAESESDREVDATSEEEDEVMKKPAGVLKRLAACESEDGSRFEFELLKGYFHDCLFSENSSLVNATARVAQRKDVFTRPNPFVRLRDSSNPPALRDVANVLIAAALRNNTCLEGLHAGSAELRSEQKLHSARFSDPELQKLHSQASANLAAIMALADIRMRTQKYLSGRGPSPEWLSNLPEEQLSAMRQQCKDKPELDELRMLYSTGAGPALGSADHWDTDTRSGGLWMDLAPLNSPLVALKQLSRPELQSNCKQQDEVDLMWTWRAWHIMRVVFIHTAFLRGPCREDQYSPNISAIDDDDMKSMLIQASSNLEKVLHQWANLTIVDFESWLLSAAHAGIDPQP